jgi:hypothetical protein
MQSYSKASKIALKLHICTLYYIKDTIMKISTRLAKQIDAQVKNAKMLASVLLKIEVARMIKFFKTVKFEKIVKNQNLYLAQKNEYT